MTVAASGGWQSVDASSTHAAVYAAELTLSGALTVETGVQDGASWSTGQTHVRLSGTNATGQTLRVVVRNSTVATYVSDDLNTRDATVEPGTATQEAAVGSRNGLAGRATLPQCQLGQNGTASCGSAPTAPASGSTGAPACRT